MAETSSGAAPSIRPLSEDAIARLRSSVTINTLAGCIQQLIMNSLDATARSIDVTVNLERNSVTVEDDGTGVLPSDMPFICERYATSKSATDGSTFGYHGETLASLATHAHLHFISRHRSYRSTHSVRFHYGKQLERKQVTNNSQMMVSTGTKVTVDRLWGNMPVRLKSRPPTEKEWEEVMRVTAELAMVVRSTKIILRNEETGKKLLFGENVGYDGSHDEKDTEKYYLRIMRQLHSTQEVPRVDSWETVMGTDQTHTITGMVCKEGSPSKGFQFILLNGVPVAYSSTSMLYATVNQLFGLSTFGTIEETTRPSRQSAPKKAVDRHPMFVLKIETGTSVMSSDDFDAENASVVKDVVALLQQLVEEFLKVGGWVRMSLPIAKQNAEKERRTPKKPPIATGDGIRLLDISQWSKVKSSHDNPVEEAGRSITGGKKKEQVVLTQVAGDPNSLVWVNPSNHKTVIIDARTGNVKTHRNTTATENQKNTPRERISITGKRQKRDKEEQSEWFKKILTDYKSPIYVSTEKPITQINNPTNPSQVNVGSNSLTVLEKISKTSLRNATIISQVDKKYVLIRINGSLLVMVDQHAADERIRVERLWKTITDKDYEPTPLKKPIVFMPSTHEHTLFKKYTQDFLDWNIIMDVQEDMQKTVTIRALPSIVADRCVEQPSIAVGLVRGYARELEDQRHTRSQPLEEDTWINKMTKAPRGLVDIVNSRACRSAIMFNDPLTLGQCEKLVEELSMCSFPFQCAHGRPSMVPIVDVGGWDKGVDDDDGVGSVGKRGFLGWMKTLED